MEGHGDKERFQLLQQVVVGTLGYLRELLLDLPVPIDTPEFLGEDGPAHEAVLALDRARRLIQDEPISDLRKTVYGHLVLEWFTAYEMLILRGIAGPAPWRLDAAEFAISRFTTIAEMIEENDLNDPDEL